MNHTLSKYGRVFCVDSAGWQSDREFNLEFLRYEQNYFNDRLKYKGYVFLRDVYEELGFPVTQESIVVGWVYDENNPNSDNYIDFSLPALEDSDDTFIPVNFNVDGDITKHFKRES